MTTVIEADLSAALEQLRLQIADLATRLELLEQCGAATGGVEMAPTSDEGAAAIRAEAVPAEITEEELIAISAALGAYLGVRAHIRQIRLVGTTAWAQQGRVSIQASHRLQG
jgi:methylmalonyl-CoA carboxyltransferase large subunit